MAIELQLNPHKLGKISSTRSEPWKLPLAKFIEALYFKRFQRSAPKQVISLEARYQAKHVRSQRRSDRRKSSHCTGEPCASSDDGAAEQPAEESD
jgi:hypothetical protein